MPDPALAALEKSFQLLSIEAVLFSALSALFGMFITTSNAKAADIGKGVYFVLFVIAVWSTYGHKSGTFQTRLRIITIVQYVLYRDLRVTGISSFAGS